METENGIHQEESGQLKGPDNIAVRGSYSYTGSDGVQYAVEYIADENGFQPLGQHLPTAPPVPEAILRSLEQNAAAGNDNDDGQYHPEPETSRHYLSPNVNKIQAGYRY